MEATPMQAYSNPKRETYPHALPDVEVFYLTAHQAASRFEDVATTDIRLRADHWQVAVDNGDAVAGWYWWPCFPGCLPDGDPVGPFATEAEALADAREGVDDE